MTKTFKIGKTYSTRSACDYECIFSFTVKARSAKFVTLEDRHGRTRRAGVYNWNGIESCRPMGSYSMAPVITAEKEAF